MALPLSSLPAASVLLLQLAQMHPRDGSQVGRGQMGLPRSEESDIGSKYCTLMPKKQVIHPNSLLILFTLEVLPGKSFSDQ